MQQDAVEATEKRRQVERWFVRRGLPHAIADYRASTDVFTRAAPFLSLVFLLELFASFGDRYSGWAQAGVFFAGLAIMIGAVALVNRIRGRRLFRLPDDIGPLEIAVFVLVPPILPAVFGEDRALSFVTLIGINIAVVVLAYVVTSYGLVPMTRWAAGQMLRQLGGLSGLFLRSLPLLLLFATFLFLNAEVWQVAHDFEPAYYGIVVGLLFAVAVLFLVFRLPREIDRICSFDRWDTVCGLAESSDAPLGTSDRPEGSDPPDIEALSGAARANVVLLLLVSQVVQLVLVAVVVGGFYVVFGLFSVREETLLQWTTTSIDTFDPIARWDLFGGQMVLTWEVLAVSGFIAAFSGLQFAVSALTDQTYREEFFATLEHEAREVLAVRALYLVNIGAGSGPSG